MIQALQVLLICIPIGLASYWIYKKTENIFFLVFGMSIISQSILGVFFALLDSMY